MSSINNNQIHDRLKILSQIEPSSESTGRAVQRTRDALLNKANVHQYTGTTIWRNIFRNPIIKFAAAAVLMIGFGYIGGRLSAGQPLDVEELRAALESSLRTSLEPALRRDLTEEMNERWQSAFATNCAQLKDELQQQVRRDLMEFATQTLAASGTMTNQRLIELARLIEAARIKDRERIETAFKQIEFNQTQLGKSLLAIASRKNELLDIKEN
ncbi:MAG: hypothetical protein H8D56_18220 [Planctomycetes bacterium]|nr:hypothetical protein [Planctomycetota bacterium]MBL7143789.1 hypothetical protein [Phycisphaerae bacterium]